MPTSRDVMPLGAKRPVAWLPVIKNEHVEQAIGMARAERPHRVGQIDDPSARSIDVEHVGNSRLRTNTVQTARPSLPA